MTFATGTAAFTTVAPDEDLGLASDAFVGLVSALAVGLFLYFWDIPARSAAFNENQPTDYLERQFPDVKPSELLTAYLLLLNTKMPSNTRNRSLYMGSMYRIGLEMILALGIATYLVFGSSLLAYGPSVHHGSHWPRLISAATLILSFGLSLVISHGYERRSAEKSRESATRMGRTVRQDLMRLSTLIYLAGLVLMVTPNLTVLIEAWGADVCRALVTVGMAVCFFYWVYRYVRGYSVDPETPRKRKRFHSATSGLLFVVPIVVSLVIYGAEDQSVLGRTNLMVAWTGAAWVVLMSVVIRGHERKLHGVYVGQTRWLKENPQAMSSVLEPRQAASPRGAATPDGVETSTSPVELGPSG
ncbi:hypothetical protein QWY28_00020 [Nocardioides sp. SOB77]|uniref:APC family permease n=1 Tax=Nocardioides oceani TaxID=3058369 RepID=A0ABT8F9F3_9ACTN|nr:hypothetical protein [Nocardioides oceani]MDN4171319.1 hypothetical protein [Nocardioides oceani]